MDKAVGRMVDYLDKNQSENTLIIFTSDNGPETFMRYYRATRSYGSPGDLKGMKLWTNEAGIRVPCIVNWKGKNGFSGTSDAVVSALDFMPTFCEVADAELPQNKIDGESISALFSQGKFERTKPLIWSFYNALNDHMVAMRMGNLKIMARIKNDSTFLPRLTNIYDGNEELVKSSKLSDFVLYDLENDLGEENDLSQKNPDEFSKMKNLLEAEYKNLLADSHIWSRGS